MSQDFEEHDPMMVKENMDLTVDNVFKECETINEQFAAKTSMNVENT